MAALMCFFFQGSDRGTGIFTVGPPRFVGGTNSDSGSSGGFVEVLGSGSPAWSAYQALEFGSAPEQVWGKVAAAASTSDATFDDTIVGESVDDAGGVEWDQFATTPLDAGATAAFEIVVRSAVPSALQLNPTNAGAAKGVPISITATATDSNGQPYAGRLLRWEITGVNPAIGMTRLDAAGTGVMVDPGTNGGFDTVVAWVDFDEDAERDPVEPQASALATFVDTTPPTCTVKVSGDRPGGGGAGKPLVITISCDDTVTVTTDSSLQIGRPPRIGATAYAPARKRRGKTIPLEPTTATIAPGSPALVDVVIPPEVARKYAGKKVLATVTVTATDTAGNVAQTTATQRIKLAKFKKRPK